MSVMREKEKTAPKRGDDGKARTRLLPYLPVDRILEIFAAAPGNEISSRKFESLESSAALAANAFGLFIDGKVPLPALPGLETFSWPPTCVRLEAQLRLPWRGGRHPCFDAVIRTADALIGIESKRYEPYRPKTKTAMSRSEEHTSELQSQSNLVC